MISLQLVQQLLMVASQPGMKFSSQLLLGYQTLIKKNLNFQTWRTSNSINKIEGQKGNKKNSNFIYGIRVLLSDNRLQFNPKVTNLSSESTFSKQPPSEVRGEKLCFSFYFYFSYFPSPLCSASEDASLTQFRAP